MPAVCLYLPHAVHGQQQQPLVTFSPSARCLPERHEVLPEAP